VDIAGAADRRRVREFLGRRDHGGA
jgi:hypothetical protein